MVATVIISAIIFGFMAFVVVRQVKKAKNGESSCGCGCNGCSSSSVCHGNKVER